MPKEKTVLNRQDQLDLVEIFQQIEIEGYIHTNDGYMIFGRVLKSKPIQENYDLEKFKEVLNYFKEYGLKDITNGDKRKNYTSQLIVFIQSAFKNPELFMQPNYTLKLQTKTNGNKDITKKTIQATDRSYYNQLVDKVGNEVMSMIEECRKNETTINTGYKDEEIYESSNKVGCNREGCKNGYIKQKDGNWDYCQCYINERFRVRMLKSGIPKDYFNIHNIKTENLNCFRKMYGASMQTTKTLDINAFIQKYSENIHQIKNEGWNFIIEGPTGSYKTTAACIFGKEAIKNEYNVLFVELQKLRKIWTGEKLTEELENIKKRLYSSDFLILDDLGQEFMSLQSDYQNSELDLLLRERISEKKCTIITTNAKETDIRTRYQERIYSLLQKKFIHIIMNTKEDARKQEIMPDFLFN